jgi:hypothetical protein
MKKPCTTTRVKGDPFHGLCSGDGSTRIATGPHERSDDDSHSHSGLPESADIAKTQAKRLAKALDPASGYSHSQILELVAKLHGERSWGAMNSRFAEKPPTVTEYDLGYRPVGPDEPVRDRNHRGWKSDELERFVKLLRTHPIIRVSDDYRVKLRRVVQDGCVSVGSVDILLDAASSALGDFAFSMPGARLVKLLGIKTESYLHRPSETANGTSGYEAISVAGAASLMMCLERFGLDSHPEFLVDAVNRAAANRAMLTRHEIECLWYSAEKHGSGRQRLMASAYQEDTDAIGDSFDTATGHRCTVFRDAAGTVETVKIDPPHLLDKRD